MNKSIRLHELKKCVIYLWSMFYSRYHSLNILEYLGLELDL